MERSSRYEYSLTLGLSPRCSKNTDGMTVAGGQIYQASFLPSDKRWRQELNRDPKESLARSGLPNWPALTRLLLEVFLRKYSIGSSTLSRCRKASIIFTVRIRGWE